MRIVTKTRRVRQNEPRAAEFAILPQHRPRAEALAEAPSGRRGQRGGASGRGRCAPLASPQAGAQAGQAFAAAPGNQLRHPAQTSRSARPGRARRAGHRPAVAAACHRSRLHDRQRGRTSAAVSDTSDLLSDAQLAGAARVGEGGGGGGCDMARVVQRALQRDPLVRTAARRRTAWAKPSCCGTAIGSRRAVRTARASRRCARRSPGKWPLRRHPAA